MSQLNNKLNDLLGEAKKELRKAHFDLMSKVPPEKRGEVQSMVDNKIAESIENNGNSIGSQFMKDIYGR